MIKTPKLFNPEAMQSFKLVIIHVIHFMIILMIIMIILMIYVILIMMITMTISRPMWSEINPSWAEMPWKAFSHPGERFQVSFTHSLAF